MRQARLMGGRFQVDEAAAARAVQRAAELATELEQQPVGYQEVVRANLVVLLVTATRAALPSLGALDPPVDPLIGRVFDLIEERFSTHVSLEDVASEVGVSGSHLTRVVRRVTGETVMHWLTSGGCRRRGGCCSRRKRRSRPSLNASATEIPGTSGGGSGTRMGCRRRRGAS